VLAILFSKTSLHFWEGAVTFLINGLIPIIVKFQDATTALYRYSGHQLPSEAVAHAKECRPLS
jgi:hypothetical protein